jgi:hypothetical protein
VIGSGGKRVTIVEVTMKIEIAFSIEGNADKEPRNACRLLNKLKAFLV